MNWHYILFDLDGFDLDGFDLDGTLTEPKLGITKSLRLPVQSLLFS